jgi:hypothetical protein
MNNMDFRIEKIEESKRKLRRKFTYFSKVHSLQESSAIFHYII